MKIALGMIIRSLESDAELMSFLTNAEKYGHKLDGVIVAYTHQLDPRAEQRIKKKLPFYSVDIKNPRYCYEQFRRRGIRESAAATLLECPIDTKGGLVPYGYNRTIVVMEAILRGFDTLFFVDSDVYPTVLKQGPEGVAEEDVDFFGAHLEHLQSGSQVTTGEYSGYNILPPASFDNMDDLLAGLQKSDMLDYWQSSETHRSLMLQPPEAAAKPCSKILGGNCAIALSAFNALPPFFSSYYTLGGGIFLCRGEDTLLGAVISKSEAICTDVGIYPLHDTYKDYPKEPDLRGDPAVQERFYYACAGWVGRNPLISYILGADLPETRETQRERLALGLRALVGYTTNRRFHGVLRNFDTSWDNLGRYINEYEQVLEAWKEFTERIGLQ